MHRLPRTLASNDSALPEKQKRVPVHVPELVRVEVNIDAQPIWAPSAYADERKREYQLSWRSDKASVTVQASGEYGMLRTFDKLVLTALVHLWNEHGRRDTGIVYFQVIDVIRVLERKNDGRLYEQIKESLHRLRGCLIQYRFSFYDADSREMVSLRDKTILSDLLIVEPRKDEDSVATGVEGLTYARLDFMVVANLLGNYTRPVSLRLLQSLSERGVLFESYVNAVLYRNEVVRKDVFELWQDLGLSTKGLDYGSPPASRMRNDLQKIKDDPGSLLGDFAFEKSKCRARSQNLVLTKKKSVAVTAPLLPHAPKYRTSDTPTRHGASRSSDEIEALVAWMQFELHDSSDDATNLRLIASRMPEKVIRQSVYDAFAYYRDGHTRNPTAYFIGIMKRQAKEMGVDLGLPARGIPSAKAGPDAARHSSPTRERRGGGVRSMAALAQEFLEQAPTENPDAAARRG